MEKWLSVKVYPTKYCIGVCVKDITDVKKAKELAEESSNILSAFFENSPVGLAIYDEKMTILNIDNSSAKIFFGKKPKEIIGKSLKKIAPKNAERISSIFEKVVLEHKPIISELSLQDTQGNILYGLSSRFPLVFSGGKKGVGTITLDITERVKEEKRKDSFIAMASHELKTPLTSARIFIQILQKRFNKFHDFESMDILKKVDEKIKHLELLIKELLDATIASQGRLVIKKDVFILKDVALEIINELQMSTKHKLMIKWETKEYLYADKEKVSQIFVNFITNAIKYSPDTTNIIIRSHKDENFIVISVQDFGIGIPKEDQAFIFNRFYQSTKHATYPGLGLGLYIAKEIITELGGQIWLKSEEGKGSTFYFSLPIYKNPA